MRRYRYGRSRRSRRRGRPSRGSFSPSNRPLLADSGGSSSGGSIEPCRGSWGRRRARAGRGWRRSSRRGATPRTPGPGYDARPRPPFSAVPACAYSADADPARPARGAGRLPRPALARAARGVALGAPRRGARAGIGRHVVRFVEYDGALYALKELPAALAAREYRLLRELGEPRHRGGRRGRGRERAGAGGRRRAATSSSRATSTSPCPYRLAARARGPRRTGSSACSTRSRELLVRLHLSGFFWGDCSLSNALFRRDAGELAAYLVDAETGELTPQLSDGQRGYDLAIARGERLRRAARRRRRARARRRSTPSSCGRVRGPLRAAVVGADRARRSCGRARVGARGAAAAPGRARLRRRRGRDRRRRTAATGCGSSRR